MGKGCMMWGEHVCTISRKIAGKGICRARGGYGERDTLSAGKQCGTRDM